MRQYKRGNTMRCSNVSTTKLNLFIASPEANGPWRRTNRPISHRTSFTQIKLLILYNNNSRALYAILVATQLHNLHNQFF